MTAEKPVLKRRKAMKGKNDYRMKVKELVAELQKLDQEKGIILLYDSFYVLNIFPLETATEEEAKMFKEDGVEVGDYMIMAE